MERRIMSLGRSSMVISLPKNWLQLNELNKGDVDHFTFFILRLLRSAAQNPVLANELRVDPLDCMDHETLVYSMEHTADYAADVARHMIMLDGTKEEMPNDICELMLIAGTLAIESYAKAVNTFFSKDLPT